MSICSSGAIPTPTPESDGVHFDEGISGVNSPSDPTYTETVKYVIIYV